MKCSNCNQEITQKGKYRFCSERCHYDYWLRIKRKTFTEKKCTICNNVFMPRSGIQKYCSHKCKTIDEIRKKSKKPNVKTCKQCNKQFEPYTSLDKFCSANCRIENQKSKRSFQWKHTEHIIGENNPAYRNGNYIRGRKKLTEGESKFIRISKNLKQNMLDTVGYVYCENCSTSNSLRFEAHHIIFRSEKPLHEYLHNEQNILIVCIQCHNEFHKHKSLRNEIVKTRELHKLFGNDILEK